MYLVVCRWKISYSKCRVTCSLRSRKYSVIYSAVPCLKVHAQMDYQTISRYNFKVLLRKISFFYCGACTRSCKFCGMALVHYQSHHFRHFTRNPQFPVFQKPEEWEAVLDLACRFEMTNVKQMAAENMALSLENKPALQVHLGRKNHVKEWVVSGLNKLIQRAEPLNKEEAELVGVDDALKVMALRETCMYDPHNCRWTRRDRGHAPIDFAATIRRGFNI